MLTDTDNQRHTVLRPTLVLGVGNILCRDDGVGVRVVEALDNLALPPGIELLDGGTAGIDLLDALADRHKVVIIDAMDGANVAGAVMRLSPDDLQLPSERGASLHDLGILETLAMARQLGIAPRDVVIIGVRAHDLGSGLELSPETTRLLPEIINCVLSEVEREAPAEKSDALVRKDKSS